MLADGSTPPPATLTQLLARQLQQRPDAPFLSFRGQPPLSFAAMDELSSRLAVGLRRLGLGKGDRLALMLPNCAEFVPLWFAAAKLGAVETPVNPELKERLLEHVLCDCGATILVCHAAVLEAVARALHGRAVFKYVIVVGGGSADAASAGIAVDATLAYEQLSSETPRAFAPDVVKLSDPIAIMYTSGTTGAAKGVILPHYQYYRWAVTMAQSMRLTSADVYYTPLPLFHGDAQFFGVYFPLVYGAQGALYERFSASRYWSQVRECGATATNMLGAMAHILLRAPPSPEDRAHRVRVCQAIPMVSIKEQFEERFGLSLVTAYGQTETSLVTYDTPGQGRPGSCGRVDGAFSLRIVDEDDQELPARAVGEIVIRPNAPWAMFRGYHGRFQHTVEAWRNLWFHTGDRGWLDEDGWLYFAGRCKDVIRRRGENVSAEEVESVVLDHPGVSECAAIAVASELSEEDIKIVVVLNGRIELTEPELARFCAERMPSYMVPRYVEFHAGPLPRTPSEKIAKDQLRARERPGYTWDRGAR